eukprot:Gb_33513 [translate_table: standard]
MPALVETTPPEVLTDPHQLLQFITNASQLTLLIHYIDAHLRRINKDPAASQNGPASIHFDQTLEKSIDFASKMMKTISTESEKGRGSSEHNYLASKVIEEARRVVTQALKKLGQLHWIALGFSVLAFVLERIDTVSSNQANCLQLLERMRGLAKRVLELNERMPNESEGIDKAVHVMVEGSVICCCHIKDCQIFRYLYTQTMETILEETSNNIKQLYEDLGVMILMDIQGRVPRRAVQSQNELLDGAPPATLVRKLLDIDGSGSALAVIVYGFGGVGKTTLANYVVSKLPLEGFCLCIVRMDIKDENINIKSLQENIIFDLGGGARQLVRKHSNHFKECRIYTGYDEENLSAKLLYVYHNMKDVNAREAFLDICTLFHGWDWEDVSSIVGEVQLKALQNGALLKNVCDQVFVHDVLRAMGCKEAGDTRLQSLDDWEKIWHDKDKLKNVRGIWLAENKSLFSLQVKLINRMSDSLRVLALGDGPPQTLKELRLKSPPNDMYPQQTMWKSIADMSSLRKFELRDLKTFDCFPKDFWFSATLVELDLSYCSKLQELPQGLILRLTALTKLNLEGCKALESLPVGLCKLHLLKQLNLNGCESVTTLPGDIGQLSTLQSLDISKCNFKQLPESFGALTRLEQPNLKNCKSLECLPANFGKLSLLKSLDLFMLESIVELPESIGNLYITEGDYPLNSSYGG